jgi:hypothetical protein
MAQVTKQEKTKIQKLYDGGQTEAEIAKSLKRSVATVRKYLATESVDELENERLKAEIATLKNQLEEKKADKVELLDEVVIGTIHKLKLSGIKKEDAEFALKKVQDKLTERIDDSSRLAAICMRELSVKNAMITETTGGRGGVAIMTGTASEIIEEKQKMQTETRTRRNCLFNPKTGEVT